MIELTFKGNSLAEVFESMKAALAGENAVTAEQTMSTSVRQEEVEETKPTVTLAEIQSLTKAKLEEKKSAAIKKLLAEFGVFKVGQISEEDYNDFYTRLGEL